MRLNSPGRNDAVTPGSLRSPRLLLRLWCEEDLDRFAGLSADPAVMQYLMPLPDRAASDAAAQRYREHFARHGFGFWAVELPGACPFIGFVGLLYVPYEAHFTPAVEVAWRLDSRYWGRGYASEAASAALDDGFERLGLAEIVAVTVPANRRSRAVMERLGMRRTAADDFASPRVPDGHPLKRHVLYRLQRRDLAGPPDDCRPDGSRRQFSVSSTGTWSEALSQLRLSRSTCAPSSAPRSGGVTQI
jgi:RimJ/RimL family protein N-acetyltransferase